MARMETKVKTFVLVDNVGELKIVSIYPNLEKANEAREVYLNKRLNETDRNVCPHCFNMGIYVEQATMDYVNKKIIFSNRPKEIIIDMDFV